MSIRKGWDVEDAISVPVGKYAGSNRFSINKSFNVNRFINHSFGVAKHETVNQQPVAA